MAHYHYTLELVSGVYFILQNKDSFWAQVSMYVLVHKIEKKGSIWYYPTHDTNYYWTWN